MRIILKTITIFIMAFFIILLGLNINLVSGYDCGSDEACYQESVEYIVIDKYTAVCYTYYYYNNRFYKLKVPCTRQEFIKLEYKARAGQLDYNSYEYRLVNLNQLLIKKGLEPLYY